jgi:dTDP-4-dehydrorhamnose 3,5-epimerase
MLINKTKIPGCFELTVFKTEDARGSFVKTFHKDLFEQNGLNTGFAEEYYSHSVRGVIRGLHFQTPPMAHTKLVYCAHGTVMDAVVDLRVGSPTYGQHEVVELSADKGNLLYIPKGLSHGFAVLSDGAVVVYNVTTIYSPECDMGILWNSVGIPWLDNNPIMSERDKTFVTFEEFDSPFVFEPATDQG